MLTCEICGEELLLQEDMKTHLLLSHLENDMSCPLCSLAGVSYDELRFHVSAAHPEEQPRPQSPSGSTCSDGRNPCVTKTKKTQTRCSCAAGNSCDTAGEAAPTSSSHVPTDSVRPKKKMTRDRVCPSPGEAVNNTLTTQRPKTRQDGIKPVQNKAKQEQH